MSIWCEVLLSSGSNSSPKIDSGALKPSSMLVTSGPSSGATTIGAALSVSGGAPQVAQLSGTVWISMVSGEPPERNEMVKPPSEMDVTNDSAGAVIASRAVSERYVVSGCAMVMMSPACSSAPENV